MQQLLHGDFRSVFDVVYGLYQQPIERYLVTCVHDQESARELCQETFVCFWQFLLTQGTVVQPVAYHKNWLYKTAKYRAIDYLRRKKPIGYLSMLENEAYTQLPELTVEGEDERTCNRLWFQDAIAQLPMKERGPLLLKYHDGYSQKEIAEKYAISEAAVSMNVSSGKTQLRKYFQVAVGQQREIQNRQNWGQDALKLLSDMRDDLDTFPFGWIPASPEHDKFLPSGGSAVIDKAVQRVVDNTDLLNNSWVKQGNKSEYIEAKLIEADPSGELLAWIRTLITLNSHH